MFLNRKIYFTRKLFYIFPLILGVSFYSIQSMAETHLTLEVGKFSSEPIGQKIPLGWEELIFEKISRHTQYEIVEDEGTRVVRAKSHASASGLVRKMKINIKEYPIIQWRWKVSNVIQGSNVQRKDGDDYSARIYITFEYDSKKVGFLRKAKYNIGRLLLGDIPIAAINYIWESKTPVGTIVDNAYTDFVKMVVVESGKEKVGEWVLEERNLYEDYMKAFKEEPPLVNGIAIMTDTDNTGEIATAYYGDIIFKKDSE